MGSHMRMQITVCTSSNAETPSSSSPSMLMTSSWVTTTQGGGSGIHRVVEVLYHSFFLLDYCYIMTKTPAVTHIFSFVVHSEYPSKINLVGLDFLEYPLQCKNVGYCWCFCHDITVIQQKKRVI